MNFQYAKKIYNKNFTHDSVYIKIRNHAIILQFPSNKYFISSISKKKKKNVIIFSYNANFVRGVNFFRKRKKKLSIRNFNNNKYNN